jgi:D-amino-acid dehydrogenase
MKIAVIGAGIIGITTAYELALDGHEVTVFERRGAAAEETSFANAGVVAPACIAPWATPGMPGKLFRHLGRHAGMRVQTPLSLRELAWLWKWKRASKPATWLANRERMQRLAFYSKDRLHEITEGLQLEYDRNPGYTLLLRSEKKSREIQPQLQAWRDAGVPFRELTAEQVRVVEPALNTDTPFFGGIHFEQDGVGNSRQFALLLKNEAQRLGVNFRFNTTVAQIDRAQQATLLVAGEAQPLRFDALALCAGLDSADLLSPLGLKLPMAAVYGYSISAPIREPLNAPRSAVMDDRFKVAIVRMGNRVRAAGLAEIGGALDTKRDASIQTLYKVLHEWFPGAAQLSNTGAAVQEWKGARPMLPDGAPVIGASGLPGLWLNLGHGADGWAMACGSARVVTDMVGGRPPAIDVDGLGIGRLRS